MELFEILFIALFILFPILEQVLKRKKGGGGQLPESKLPEEEGRVDPRSSEREPVSASDMVPDDLWAVLTGEQRPRSGGVERGEQGEGEEPAWEEEEPASPWSREPESSEVEWEEPERSWARDLEEAAPEAPSADPVWVGYESPPDYPRGPMSSNVVSLEQPLEAPDVRHRRFHARLDEAPVERRRGRSALGRMLSRPQSLRQAFVLKEVLGSAKGLE